MRQSAPTDSPLEQIGQTLGRIGAASADGYGIAIRYRQTPGAGWFQASELSVDGRTQAGLLDRINGMYGPPAAHIRAEWLLESLARTIADLGGSFIVAAGQLPDLSPENVLLAAEGGLFRASGIASDRGISVADPPAGQGLTVLASHFRSGFTTLLEPTVSWLDRQGLRPAKTLWKAAADRLAQSLVWSGKAFDRPELAFELTDLTVGPNCPDPRLAIELERAEEDWGDEYHLRNTCCLAYRTEGGELCQSCPLVERTA